MNESEKFLLVVRFLLAYAASIMLIALSLASFNDPSRLDLFDRRYHFENILAIASMLSGIFLLVSLHIDFYLTQTKRQNAMLEGGTLLRVSWSCIAGILLLLIGFNSLNDYDFSRSEDETDSYGLSDSDNSALPEFELCIGGLLIFWPTIEKKLMKSAK